MLKKVKRIKLGIQAYRRIMKRVLERDDWRCQKCGSLENLQTLCAHCHIIEHGQLFYSAPAVKVCSKPKPRRPSTR